VYASGGRALAGVPAFNPQYCQKKRRKKERASLVILDINHVEYHIEGNYVSVLLFLLPLWIISHHSSTTITAPQIRYLFKMYPS
jgi:hypothetical protein